MSGIPRLAEVLAEHHAGHSGFECSCGWEVPAHISIIYRQHEQHQTDAWYQACQVTTFAQLDALPDGSVIRDRDGAILGRNPIGIYPSQGRPWWPLSGYSAMDRDFGVNEESIPLPALLIWAPDWKTP